jgi:hypothetical protein
VNTANNVMLSSAESSSSGQTSPMSVGLDSMRVAHDEHTAAASDTDDDEQSARNTIEVILDKTENAARAYGHE